MLRKRRRLRLFPTSLEIIDEIGDHRLVFNDTGDASALLKDNRQEVFPRG